jgi:hypothetical protein
MSGSSRSRAAAVPRTSIHPNPTEQPEPGCLSAGLAARANSRSAICAWRRPSTSSGSTSSSRAVRPAGFSRGRGARPAGQASRPAFASGRPERRSREGRHPRGAEARRRGGRSDPGSAGLLAADEDGGDGAEAEAGAGALAFVAVIAAAAIVGFRHRRADIHRAAAETGRGAPGRAHDRTRTRWGASSSRDRGEPRRRAPG